MLLAWALAWVMPRVSWPHRSYTRSAPDPPGRTFVGGLRSEPLRPLPSSISRRALGFAALGGGGRPRGLALVAISYKELWLADTVIPRPLQLQKACLSLFRGTEYRVDSFQTRSAAWVPTLGY
jgi:hypothetical protein